MALSITNNVSALSCRIVLLLLRPGRWEQAGGRNDQVIIANDRSYCRGVSGDV